MCKIFLEGTFMCAPSCLVCARLTTSLDGTLVIVQITTVV